MAIEVIQGFRASDGSCYGTKPDAYKAEILHFYRSLPVFAKQQPTPKEFGKFLGSVQDWVQRAESVRQQMADEEQETKRHLASQE